MTCPGLRSPTVVDLRANDLWILWIQYDVSWSSFAHSCGSTGERSLDSPAENETTIIPFFTDVLFSQM